MVIPKRADNMLHIRPLVRRSPHHRDCKIRLSSGPPWPIENRSKQTKRASKNDPPVAKPVEVGMLRRSLCLWAFCGRPHVSESGIEEDARQAQKPLQGSQKKDRQVPEQQTQFAASPTYRRGSLKRTNTDDAGA